MKLTKKQAEVVEMILKGENIIVVGGMRSGKTFAVNHAVKLLKKKGLIVDVFDGVCKAKNIGINPQNQTIIITNNSGVSQRIDGFTRIDFGGMD